MAEKEERIFITKIQPECKFRELHETTAGGHTWVDFMCGKSTVKKLECDDKCFEQCEWKELTGISRTEAINRIAKAICANEDEYTDCKQCGFNGPEDCKRYCRYNWLYTAEAVLEALLEEKI